MVKTFQSIMAKFLVAILLFSTFASILTFNPHPAHAAISTPYIWLANFWDDKVMKVDTTTGVVVGTYAVADPWSLAVDANSDVWVSNYINNVYKINGATGAVIGTYATGDNPNGVAIDADNNVWVSISDTDKVMKINGATGATIGTYDVGGWPAGIAVDGSGNVWVANIFDDTVTKLSVATGAVIGTYAIPASSGAYSVAVDADNNVWVVLDTTDSVVKLNGATGATIGIYAVGDEPRGVAVDGNGNVWTTNYSDGTITKLDSQTGAILGTYATNNGNEYGLSVDADNNIWVEDYDTPSIIKFNGATGARIGDYSVGVSQGYTRGDATGFALQYFVLGNRDITIAADGTGTGTFDQASPVAVLAGANLDITATADAGSEFAAWTGCDSTTDNVCHLTNIAANTTVTATFNLIPNYTVTIASDGTGTGTFDQISPVAVLAGANLDITATPAVDSAFATWTGCDSTTGNVCHLTNITSNTTVTATFDLIIPNPDSKIEFEDLPDNERIINIDENQTITTNPYTIRVNPKAKYPIKKVDFYIDGTLICTETEPDENGVFTCDWDTSKYHSTVKVIAYDIKDHAAALTRETTVDLPVPTTALTGATTLTTLPQTGADLW